MMPLVPNNASTAPAASAFLSPARWTSAATSSALFTCSPLVGSRSLPPGKPQYRRPMSHRKRGLLPLAASGNVTPRSRARGHRVVYHATQSGWIEVITGVMFSGKSEELIRRVRRAVIARKRVQVFTSHLDDRYHVFSVTTHDGLTVEAHPVSTAREIAAQARPDTSVVASAGEIGR